MSYKPKFHFIPLILCLLLQAIFSDHLWSQNETKRDERAVSGRTASTDATDVVFLPRLEKPPAIDGDLNDWKESAYHDGVWDIYRVKHSSWYNPSRNRLTDHLNEPSPEWDLQARYYFAWDERYIYMGTEVYDNVNDVTDPKHEKPRWYYKDCVCWFWEAPRDTVPESFGQGDNAFCFVIDTGYPDYGAWWRHGGPGKTYIEESLPENAVEYRIRMNPWSRNNADYILEARVDMSRTFGLSDPEWRPSKKNDSYSVEIVHTDPDGGDYGGHLIIYGTGDNDISWRKVILTEPVGPPERKHF